MKAILIDSKNREIREIEVEDNDKAIQSAIGGKRLIKGVIAGSWSGQLIISDWGDDDANFFTIEGHGGQPIIGNGLFMGISASLEEIQRRIRFIDQKNVREMAEKTKALFEAMMNSAEKGAIVRLPTQHEKVAKAKEQEVSASINPQIKGEARAMLDILSERVEEKKL